MPEAYREESGQVVIRASALGGCLRALVAARSGYPALPPPDGLEVVFKEGHLHEDAVVDYLVSHGADITDQQRTVQLAVASNIIVRGHIDGYVNRGGNLVPSPGRVLEVKSFNDDKFNLFREEGLAAFPRYEWQLAAYMLAMDLPGVLVGVNRGTTVHDEDGNFIPLEPDDVWIEVVDTPPRSLELIRERALTMEVLARRGDLPPCDVEVGWGCPYFNLHDEEEIPEAEGHLAMMIAKYGELKKVRDDAVAQMEPLADAIKEAMGEGKLAAGGFVANVYYQQPSRRVDTKRLRAMLGDEMDAYEKEVGGGLRLRVE